jgi:hypothetical protein
MKFLQPDGFKDLTKSAYTKLRQSILNNHFVESFKVWQDKKTTFCLDGFHRVKVLHELVKEGHEVPDTFRADFLNCQDKKEASKLVLIYSSVYASVTQEGLYEFASLQDLDISSMSDEIDIAGFDIDKYLKGYEGGDITPEDIQGLPESQAEDIKIKIIIPLKCWFEKNNQINEQIEAIKIMDKKIKVEM